jgi:zinc protease
MGSMKLSIIRTGRIVTAILILSVAHGWAADVPGLSAPVPSDPAVTSGSLSNGFRYLIRVNRTPAGRAELRLAVNAGSLQEDDDQRGLAHFTEHMAFDGTEHFPKQALVRFLESAGMGFGPEISASVSFDETVYRLTLPSDSAVFLDRAFLLLRDWAGGIRFDLTEVELERLAVVEECRIGRNPETRIMNKRFPLLLGGSRYAERLPLGEIGVLNSFRPETLKRFYRDWYRPERMAVVAVGDFDVGLVESLIRSHFGSLKADTPARPDVPTAVPDRPSTAVGVHSDPEASGSEVGVYTLCPAEAVRTVADYRLSVLKDLHNAMMNRRLADRADRPDPPFLYGIAGKGGLVRTKGAWFLGGGVVDNGVERGLETLLTEMERVRRYGFTPAEFEWAGKNRLRALRKRVDEEERTESAVYAAILVRSWLDDEPVPSAGWEFDRTAGLLASVRLEDINRLTADWTQDANRIVLADVPDRKGVRKPAGADLLGLFGRVRAASIEAVRDENLDAPLVAVPPVPGSIRSEKRNGRLGTVEWKLSNGVTVLLKPTDFKDGEIRFSAFSPGGNSLVPDRNAIAAATAASIVEESGAGPFSGTRLKKRLAGTDAAVTPSIGMLTEGLSGSCSARDASVLFQLIHLAFTAPRRDAEGFAAAKRRILGILENRDLRPETAFQDTLQVTLASRHSRARPWTAATLEEMNLDSSLAVYRDRFSDAGDFTFIFVGDFRPDSLRSLAETWLGGLASKGRTETWRDLGIRPPKGAVERTVRKGTEPKGRVAIVFTGPWEPGPLNEYRFETMAGFLRIRLKEVLAGDPGGASGVSVAASAVRFPYPSTTLNISFGCAPERTEDLSRTVFREIDVLRKKGPGTDVLARVREIQRRDFETDLKRNGYWLDRLSACAFQGEDPEDILRRAEWISGLTGDDIRETAVRACDDRNVVRVVLLPENGRPDGGTRRP